MPSRLHTCLACGDEMAATLMRAGSVRCHDCRDANVPLREDLVEPRLRLVPPVADDYLHGHELPAAA